MIRKQRFFAGFSANSRFRKSDLVKPGSKLRACSFIVRYVPDGSGYSEAVFDMTSETTHAFGDPGDKLERLKQALTSITPTLKEIIAIWHRLDAEIGRRVQGLPYQISDGEMSNLNFLATWLDSRATDSFNAIIDLPLVQMQSAAIAFKPTCVKSFEDDIELNTNIIRLIPKEQLTDAACRRAVRVNPASLQFIPETMRNCGLCEEAMRSKNEKGVTALQFVPIPLRNEDLCRNFILSCAHNIRHVPKLTVDLCTLACLKDAQVWEFIPERFRTLEVEFCASLHKLRGRTPHDVFLDMQRLDSVNADQMAEKYESLFIDLNYPGMSKEDLSDIENERRDQHSLERCV